MKCPWSLHAIELLSFATSITLGSQLNYWRLSLIPIQHNELMFNADYLEYIIFSMILDKSTRHYIKNFNPEMYKIPYFCALQTRFFIIIPAALTMSKLQDD